ncbi:hypothetical protein DITRI_Ditri14bG0020400 [Diplodiscus trichospermus]
MRALRDAIVDCELIDLPLKGHRFTWERGRGTEQFVEERLERCLVNMAWMELFPDATLTCLLAPVSDHNPIELCTELRVHNMKGWKFRFENSWLQENEFSTIVKRSWEQAVDVEFMQKLQICSNDMDKWGRDY